MAWCRQDSSHYLSKCGLSSMAPCGVTGPHFVNDRGSFIFLWHVLRKNLISLLSRRFVRHNRSWGLVKTQVCFNINFLAYMSCCWTEKKTICIQQTIKLIMSFQFVKMFSSFSLSRIQVLQAWSAKQTLCFQKIITKLKTCIEIFQYNRNT